MVVFLPEVPGWEVSSWTGSIHSLIAPKKKAKQKMLYQKVR